jgi:hypothetical protein
MGARHETEVVISPTIKSGLGKFIPRPARLSLQDGRAAGGYVQGDPKNVILVRTTREED